MGTKAYVCVMSNEEGIRNWTTILGMVMDGFPENLKRVAKDVQKAMEKRPGDLKDREYVESILREVVAEEPDWWFLDNINNAAWISCYGQYNPFTKKLDILDGDDFPIETLEVT
jgi:hypothetical protein